MGNNMNRDDFLGFWLGGRPFEVDLVAPNAVAFLRADGRYCCLALRTGTMEVLGRDRMSSSYVPIRENEMTRFIEGAWSVISESESFEEFQASELYGFLERSETFSIPLRVDDVPDMSERAPIVAVPTATAGIGPPKVLGGPKPGRTDVSDYGEGRRITERINVLRNNVRTIQEDIRGLQTRLRSVVGVGPTSRLKAQIAGNELLLGRYQKELENLVIAEKKSRTCDCDGIGAEAGGDSEANAEPDTPEGTFDLPGHLEAVAGDLPAIISRLVGIRREFDAIRMETRQSCGSIERAEANLARISELHDRCKDLRSEKNGLRERLNSVYELVDLLFR